MRLNATTANCDICFDTRFLVLDEDDHAKIATLKAVWGFRNEPATMWPHKMPRSCNGCACLPLKLLNAGDRSEVFLHDSVIVLNVEKCPTDCP
jgi:hypothetical protein